MLGLLNYITWDVSPFIYEGEHFAIGWYGTLWTLGLVGMLVTLLITFKHDGVPSQFALITFMVSLVCVIFFGHLFQGLFYEWRYFPDDPVHFLGTDWYYRNYYFEHPWKFFDFAHGGFASHGTVIGVLIAGWVVEKIIHADRYYATDRIMMGLCLVGIAVRLGNFFNGEICGIETNLPWGVLYDDEETALHPTQLYEAISYAMALAVSLCIFYSQKKQYGGVISGAIMAIVMLLRIAIEFIKFPQMQIEEGWLLTMGQWLSIPIAIYAIWLCFYAIKRK